MCFVCEQIFSFAARCGESTPVLLLSLPWYPVRTFLKRPRMCVVRVRVCVRESVSSRGEGRCPQVSTSAPSTSQTHAQSSTQRRHSTESSRDSLEPDTHFPPLRLRTELTEKEAKTAAIFGNIETRKLDTEHSGKHVQLGQTGAGWQQQRRRDVPDRYGGTADSLHQEAAAAGRDLSLP